MTDVNKNIFEAYKSMYEPKEEVLDEKVKNEDASNDKSDDGEGLDKVDPKAVKKKFKDRKDQDIDNDGDVDSSDEYLHKRRKAVSKAVSNDEEVKYPHMMYSKDGKDEVSVKSPEEHDKYAKKGYVHDKPDVKESFDLDDIRAMCHSKDHDCATYVDHPEFGLGKPVYESHAIPDENGHVAWYDVEFAHGIEEQVPVEDMQILQTEDHKGNGKKPMKKKEPIEDDTVINVDNDEEEAPQMDSDEKPMKKKKPPMPPKKDNGEEGDDVKEPEDDGKDVKIISKDKKKKNGNGNGNGKTAEISKIGEEVSEFTSLINELMASDAVGKKKKEKDGKEPESYDDINQERSKGETDFIDAHGKKDTVVDGEKDAETTANSQKSNKQGKHVKQQTAKGDKNIIKSTEAPVKDKEVKDGEGKKSVTKESTLMDMALKALKGQTVPEMKQIIASSEKEKNPFDARTRDAKAFLERMHKRKNGENGQYKDKDPKDLPMIKSGYGKKKGDK
ncbi:MAG: hypothetical protein CM15mV16_0980 [uncultured marine virus]|nr:MAG: hypothetical protein CM15mV16_0980 [uncultured marine virus]